MTRWAEVCARVGLACLLICFAQTSLHAQIFKLQGGDSTLFQAEGGSFDVKAPGYEGSLGAGFFEGHFQFGAVARTQFHDYTLIGGDDAIRFSLPTDIFDGGYFFYARGAGIEHSTKDQNLYFFGGVTSTWMGTSFFQSARAEDPVGILFFDRRLTKTLHFYSRAILAHRKTSLQSLEWQPRRWLKTAVSAGIGSGKGYFASSFDAETRKLALQASYVAASGEFRRITAPSILNSEADKGNIQVAYRPDSIMSFSAGHRDLLQPITLTSPLEEAAVNNLGANFSIAHSNFGLGIFNSSVAGRQTNGLNLYTGHRIHQRFEVTANYFQSRSDQSRPQTMVTGTFREVVSPRFSLLQLVTRSDGQWNMAYGGQFITNRFSASIDYQNVYLPFEPQHPFQQALMVNLTARVFGPVQLTAASSVAPDGHIRYTFGGTTYLYRYQGLAGRQPSQEFYKFSKYLLQGVVRDDQGNPLEGVALRINGATVYTDDAGRFQYRYNKHTPVDFAVALDEFLIPGVYEVVKAPRLVTPELEDQAADVEVVIRRVRAAPSQLRTAPPKQGVATSGSAAPPANP